ncbi:MAG: sigma-70 family RNA polymerase sigma factor [Planctomycetaceae bacterium]|nr:sigma-70 family RNA polymerase sigma factor [Planctomycetaceae bacterium]
MGNSAEWQGPSGTLGAAPLDGVVSPPPSASAQERFAALLEAHAGIVRRVAGAYGRGAADRGDLMQEIALQLWRSFGNYEPTRSFGTWMYRIALNVAISHLRRRARAGERTVDIQDAGEAVLVDPRIGADELAEEREGIERLQVLLAELEPLDRALVVLWLDDQSYRQISEVLGLSETNVATKLSRLKVRLRARAARR